MPVCAVRRVAPLSRDRRSSCPLTSAHFWHLCLSANESPQSRKSIPGPPKPFLLGGTSILASVGHPVFPATEHLATVSEYVSIAVARASPMSTDPYQQTHSWDRPYRTRVSASLRSITKGAKKRRRDPHPSCWFCRNDAPNPSTYPSRPNHKVPDLGRYPASSASLGLPNAPTMGGPLYFSANSGRPSLALQCPILPLSAHSWHTLPLTYCFTTTPRPLVVIWLSLNI